MASIIPKLNLNRHPKNCENCSLINANNIIISEDGTIQNELGFKYNKTIHDFIFNKYNNNYSVLWCLPCNTEIILFIKIQNEDNLKVIRYDELLNVCVVVSENFKYFGGEFEGTFTYNVDNNLIVAISEYNTNIDVPLRIINFGKIIKINDEYVNYLKEEDKNQLNNYDIQFIKPKVKIPTINKGLYDSKWYKGQNYFFIRFKIDAVNYTEWYDLHSCIYTDTYRNITLMKDKYTSSVQCSNDDLRCDIAPMLKLVDIDNNDLYKYYQLAVIIINKSSNLCKKTGDINITQNIYKFNVGAVEDFDVTDLTISNINIYSPKNVINYNNRLFISNYKEENNNIDLQEFVNNNVRFNFRKIEDTKYEDDKGNINGDYIDELSYKDKLYYINASYDKIIYEQYDQKLETYDCYIPVANFNTSYNINKYTNSPTFINLGIDIIYAPWINYNKITNDDIEFGNPIRPIHSSDDLLNAIVNDNADDYYPEDYYIEFFPSIHFNNPNTINVTNIRNPGKDLVNITDGKYKYDNRIKNTSDSSDGAYIKVYYALTYGSNLNTINDYKVNIFNEKTEKRFSLINPCIVSFSKYTRNGTFIPNYWKEDKIYINNKTYNEISNNDHYTLGIDDRGKFIIVYVAYFGSYYTYDKANNDTEFVKENPELLGEIYTKENKSDFNINIDNQKFLLKDCFYNLFIHYVDEYGNNTNGIPFVNENTFANLLFNDVEYNTDVNLIKNNLVKVSINKNYNGNYLICPTDFCKLYIQSKIPNGYIGYFISYEKFEGSFVPTIPHAMYETLNNTGSESAYYNDYGIRLETELIDLEDNFPIFNTISQYHIYEDNQNNNPNPNLQYDIVEVSNHATIGKVTAIPSGNVGNTVTASCFLVGGVTFSTGFGNVNYHSGTPYIRNKTASDPTNANSLLKDIPLLRYLRNSDYEHLYLNKNKILIPLSEYIYHENVEYIKLGNYNGMITKMTYYDIVGRFYWDAANSKFVSVTTDDGGETEITNKGYFMDLPVYYNKSIRSKYPLNNSEAVVSSGHLISYVSVDLIKNLFRNNALSIDEYYPKTLSNFRNDLDYITEFNKTIRYSNVIQSESRKIAWRNFYAEHYKNINENKGNITNIVGIGNQILVHTEHSLFVFINNDSIEALNNNIKLSNTNITDINYKEILTSQLGYGGLSEKYGWTIGNFGYIFYCSDNKYIFRYDNGQLSVINNDLKLYFNQYNINKVIFIDDINNNRILMKFVLNNTSITLTYNYISNSFISFFSIPYINGYNTKNNIYFVRDYVFNFDKKERCVHTNISYNKINNEFVELSDNIKFSFNILVNDNYESIKYLEYITYKLWDIKTIYNENNNIGINDININYSGDELEIYNDINNTGIIDIKVDTRNISDVDINNNNTILPSNKILDVKNNIKVEGYKKPYWQFGNWNLNYIFDKYKQCRVFGNWFVIKFSMNNTNGNLIEFDTINYKFSDK